MALRKLAVKLEYSEASCWVATDSMLTAWDSASPLIFEESTLASLTRARERAEPSLRSASVTVKLSPEHRMILRS